MTAIEMINAAMAIRATQGLKVERVTEDGTVVTSHFATTESRDGYVVYWTAKGADVTSILGA